MNVIDIHTHIYERVAGITRGQPMTSADLKRVAIGNEEVWFLLPSSEQNHSTAGMLIVYIDWCNIKKVVLMPNPYYGYHNRCFTDNVGRYPNRLRGVVLADVVKRQKVARELISIYDQEILSGFKMEVDSILQRAPGARLSGSGLSSVWNYCSQYHQPVLIHMFHTEDIEDAGFLASAYPSINFILCHMGADACFKKGIPGSNYREVLDLVKNRSGVFVDTPTVPVYPGEGYSWSSSVKIIQACYRHAGPEKIMWASGYPGMLNHGTMQQPIDLVGKYCSYISELHRQMVMADNIRRLFFNDQR